MKLFAKIAIALASILLTSVSFAQVALYNSIPFYPGTIVSAVAPATPAATPIKASAGYILSVVCGSILATPVYIKLFNTASVTLGTTSATMNLLCPGNTAGAGFVYSLPWPATFSTAIDYAVTGGISPTDNTAITASSVTVTFIYE
jgi:hypothetical protein